MQIKLATLIERSGLIQFWGLNALVGFGFVTTFKIIMSSGYKMPVSIILILS